MCGRFLLISSPEAVRAAFGYPERPNFPPRYNIAPTQPIAIVRRERVERAFQLVRWGLIPAWAKDPKAVGLLINARAETLESKPAFRAAFLRRRCLVPADGWYEWQATGTRTRRPFLVQATEGGPIAFAALWECYMAPDGSEIDTAAIVTTDANASLAGIHLRMPAVLPRDAIDPWLDPATEPARLLALLRPAPEPMFEPVQVSDLVNSVANDHAGLIVPAADAVPAAAPKATPAAAQLDLFGDATDRGE